MTTEVRFRWVLDDDYEMRRAEIKRLTSAYGVASAKRHALEIEIAAARTAERSILRELRPVEPNA